MVGCAIIFILGITIGFYICGNILPYIFVVMSEEELEIYAERYHELKLLEEGR